MKFSATYESKLIEEAKSSSFDPEKSIAAFKAELSKEGAPASYKLSEAEIYALTKISSAEIPAKIKEWMLARYQQLIAAAKKAVRDTESKTQSQMDNPLMAFLSPYFPPQGVRGIIIDYAHEPAPNISSDELRVLAALPYTVQELPQIKGLTPIDAKEFYLQARFPGRQWLLTHLEDAFTSFPPMVEVTNASQSESYLAKMLASEPTANQSAFFLDDYQRCNYTYGHLFVCVRVELMKLDCSDFPKVDSQVGLEIIKQIKGKQSDRWGMRDCLSRWFQEHSPPHPDESKYESRIMKVLHKDVSGRTASSLTAEEKSNACYYAYMTSCDTTIHGMIMIMPGNSTTPEIQLIPGDEKNVKIVRKERTSGKEIVNTRSVTDILSYAKSWPKMVAWEEEINQRFEHKMEVTPLVVQKAPPKRLIDLPSKQPDRYTAQQRYIEEKYPFTTWIRADDLLIPKKFDFSNDYFARLSPSFNWLRRVGFSRALVKLFATLEPFDNHKAPVVYHYDFSYIDLANIKDMSEPTLPAPESFAAIADRCKGWDLTERPSWDPDGKFLIKHAEAALKKCLSDKYCYHEHEEIFARYGLEVLLQKEIRSFALIPGNDKELTIRIAEGLYGYSNPEFSGFFHVTKRTSAKELKVPAEFIYFLVQARLEIKTRHTLAMIDDLTVAKNRPYLEPVKVLKTKTHKTSEHSEYSTDEESDDEESDAEVSIATTSTAATNAVNPTAEQKTETDSAKDGAELSAAVSSPVVEKTSKAKDLTAAGIIKHLSQEGLVKEASFAKYGLTLHGDEIHTKNYPEEEEGEATKALQQLRDYMLKFIKQEYGITVSKAVLMQHLNNQITEDKERGNNNYRVVLDLKGVAGLVIKGLDQLKTSATALTNLGGVAISVPTLTAAHSSPTKTVSTTSPTLII